MLYSVIKMDSVFYFACNSEHCYFVMLERKFGIHVDPASKNWEGWGGGGLGRGRGD